MQNKKQLTILSNLRKNARMNLAEISRNTDIPTTTVFENVYKMKGNIIKKYSPILDFYKLGMLKYFFIIKVNPQIREIIKSFLIKSIFVNSVILTTEGFFIECIFRGMKEYMEFKEELKSKENIEFKDIPVAEDLKIEEFDITLSS